MQTLPKVLCVDDEPYILESFRRQLRGRFDLEIATSGQAALSLFKSGGKFPVIISDMSMPEMDGAELLRSVQKISPSTVRVMLTGNADQETAVKAVNDGQIFRFLTKPCSSDIIEAVLNASLEQHRLITAEKELLQNTLSGSIKVLSEILSLTDPIAFGSGSVLREPVRTISNLLKIPNAWELDLAAMLHPIGWITIPDSIKEKFRKGIALTKAEEDMIIRIPELGNQFLKVIPRMENVAKIILYSTKNFDGTGFPHDTVTGTNLPLGSRVLRIASALTQLTQSGLSKGDALAKLRAQPAVYDQTILTTLEALSPEPTTEAERNSFPIQPNQLCPGQRLTEDLYATDGRLLLGANTYLSELLCKSIVNYAANGNLKLPIMVDCKIPSVSRKEIV